MQIPTIFVASLAAAAVSTAVCLALRPSPAEPPPDGGVPRVVAELQQQVQRLGQQLDAMAREAPAVAAAKVDRAVAPGLSSEAVAAAVEAYLVRRGGSAGAGSAVGASPAGEFDLDTGFGELVGTTFWNNADHWRRAFAAGRMDEVLARFEQEAKQHPRDAQAQMNYANACLAYLQMDQSKWQLSMSADAAFDRVLDIDENHWDARFSKAMSYTFWPDFLGKKKEAIQHFETLVAQQQSLPVQDHHAQTYLFLGNLLEQRDPARAREIWQQGAARHPANQELRQKLGR